MAIIYACDVSTTIKNAEEYLMHKDGCLPSSMLYSPVDLYRRFISTYCLYHQGDEFILPDYTARRQSSSRLRQFLKRLNILWGGLRKTYACCCKLAMKLSMHIVKVVRQQNIGKISDLEVLLCRPPTPLCESYKRYSLLRQSITWIAQTVQKIRYFIWKNFYI